MLKVLNKTWADAFGTRFLFTDIRKRNFRNYLKNPKVNPYLLAQLPVLPERASTYNNL